MEHQSSFQKTLQLIYISAHSEAVEAIQAFSIAHFKSLPAIHPHIEDLQLIRCSALLRLDLQSSLLQGFTHSSAFFKALQLIRTSAHFEALSKRNYICLKPPCIIKPCSRKLNIKYKIKVYFYKSEILKVLYFIPCFKCLIPKYNM